MGVFRTDRIVHDVDERGKLYFLLNALLGAYNRRTDVMERAVKLDERVKAMEHKLDVGGDALKAAVDRNQPK